MKAILAENTIITPTISPSSASLAAEPAVCTGNGSGTTRKQSSQQSVYSLMETAALANIDAPLKNETVSGNYYMYGWALDTSGVSKVEVLVDGAVKGQAVYGDARADVYAAYPAYNNQNAGFHYSLNAEVLTDGNHTITIRVTNTGEEQYTMPDRTISVAALTAGAVTTNYTYDDN